MGQTNEHLPSPTAFLITGRADLSPFSSDPVENVATRSRNHSGRRDRLVHTNGLEIRAALLWGRHPRCRLRMSTFGMVYRSTSGPSQFHLGVAVPGVKVLRERSVDRA